jgi:hypothetical protein
MRPYAIVCLSSAALISAEESRSRTNPIHTGLFGFSFFFFFGAGSEFVSSCRGRVTGIEADIEEKAGKPQVANAPRKRQRLLLALQRELPLHTIPQAHLAIHDHAPFHLSESEHHYAACG